VTDTGGQGPARAGGRGTVAVAGTDPAPGPGGPPPVPVVVVAGRPNVGKSTLVNRIVGRRAAVVEERPGVTRDRLELEAQWAGRVFTVVDTGGWTAAGDALDAKVSAQAERAVAGADLVLLVVDVTVGVTEDDLAMVRWLRRRARAVRVVANKVDNERRELDAWELVQLGLGDPIAVSAMHGRGVGDLLDLVVAAVAAPPAEALAGASVVDGAGGPGRTLQTAGDERLAGADGDPFEPPALGPGGRSGGPARAGQPVDGHEASPAASREVAAEEAVAVALVGRPNVGKSTLFNRLIGDDRSIVHDLPGTTRDAIDTVVDSAEGRVRFVDTAGIGRRSRSQAGTEFYAMVRALQALDAADVALLVIDATAGVTHQDQRLAERIGASGSPVVVVLNKWELVDTDHRPTVLADVEDRLAFLGDVPVLKVSARTGLGVHKVLPALRRAVDAYRTRIPTGALNRVLRDLQQAHPAPGARIRYGVQATAEPPTFTLFATRRLPASYLRYVERRLREAFGIGPTPITFRVRVGGRS
jgi:GTP-binding protein